MNIYYHAIKEKVEYVKKEDLLKYMQDNWNIKLSKKAKKDDVIAEFLKNVNDTTAKKVVSDLTSVGISYTASQVKDILKISDYKVNRMIKNGTLHVVDYYRNPHYSTAAPCRLISAVDVLELLAS